MEVGVKVRQMVSDCKGAGTGPRTWSQNKGRAGGPLYTLPGDSHGWGHGLPCAAQSPEASKALAWQGHLMPSHQQEAGHPFHLRVGEHVRNRGPILPRWQAQSS